MGPVLHFRGISEPFWRLSALLVTETGAAIETLRVGDAPPVWPCRLAEARGKTLWRYDFALLPRGEAERSVDYAIGRQRWRIRLPARGGDLRIAYTSCNGTPEGEVWRDDAVRNERWRHLAATHAARPFHLLLQGGDQIYADSVWREVPALAKWRRLPPAQRLAHPFTAAMSEAVDSYYFNRYRILWSQPAVAAVLAEVPSLMMWDDHDIFDGWGSYDPDWQACPVFQGIWAAARRHFVLFQLAAAPDELPDAGEGRGSPLGWSYRLGQIGIAALDLRSERTQRRVMGEAGWRVFMETLDAMAGCRELLILLSVPLINIDWSTVERLLDLLPGHPPHRRDLRDQWRSRARRGEWLRMVRCLFRFASDAGTRVTILSGEIHMGALGTITDGRATVHQLISSGIAHPPLPAPLVFTLNRIGRGRAAIAPDLTLRLLSLPGLGYRFMRARNWLSIELPATGGLTAIWHGADGNTSGPFRM